MVSMFHGIYCRDDSCIEEAKSHLSSSFSKPSSALILLRDFMLEKMNKPANGILHLRNTCSEPASFHLKVSAAVVEQPVA